jgi:GT2 family glycosyltransferase
VTVGAGRPLSVVIPNFNGAAVLPRCLAALHDQTVAPAEIVVVDNGSTDGSDDAAEGSVPGLRVIRVGRNSGFGAAANLGVAHTSTPLVAVLNSDARPAPDWLALMSTFVCVGAWSWGGVLVSPSGVIESAGDCYSPHGFAYKHGKGGDPAGLPATPYEVFAPPGAAPVFEREVFLALGGYDERYFLYLEDIDLAFRARSRGHTSWVVPAARVEHDLGASGTARVATWHIARNALWCQLTNVPQLHPRLVWQTSVRELRDARARGAGAAYLRGRLSAARAVPRLLQLRRQERRERLVSDETLMAAAGLPGDPG